jgi:serine/threonine protein phosphatase PrpC
MSSVSYAVTRGARGSQEDFYFSRSFGRTKEKNWVLAVLDGHGGSHAAKLGKERLEEIFTPRVFTENKDIPAFLKRTIRLLVSETNQFQRCGSTVSIACVMEKKKEAVIAVLGDSPVLVISSSAQPFRASEHNVRTSTHERAAAIARGGRFDGNYICNERGAGLQLSRALGDGEMGQIISRTPEIYTIPDPTVVMVGTDGLLEDPEDNQDAAFIRIVNICKNGGDAKAVLHQSSDPSHDQSDNATALVWRKG